MWCKISLCICVLLFACTKQPNTTVVTSNKPLVTPVKDPERLIFEANVVLPKEHRAKVKKTDILLWDLKDSRGDIIASEIQELPKFPFHLKVVAKDMRQAIPEDTVLIFSARLVHFGQEHNPPVSGELNAVAGIVPSKAEVVNPNVDKKRLEKWEKKTKFDQGEVLSVGAKVTAPLAPSLW
jgi:hypothetical protein